MAYNRLNTVKTNKYGKSLSPHLPDSSFVRSDSSSKPHLVAQSNILHPTSILIWQIYKVERTEHAVKGATVGPLSVSAAELERRRQKNLSRNARRRRARSPATTRRARERNGIAWGSCVLVCTLACTVIFGWFYIAVSLWCALLELCMYYCCTIMTFCQPPKRVSQGKSEHYHYNNPSLHLETRLSSSDLSKQLHYCEHHPLFISITRNRACTYSRLRLYQTHTRSRISLTTARHGRDLRT